jgi:DNA-binding transcriptional ArsR family regulator
MEIREATRLFECLSSETRVGIYRLLVKQGAIGLVAGEISGRLGMPPSSISFHLKAMTHAGLLSVVQEGRFLRYRADLSLMLELVAYLTQECCADQSAICASATVGA